MTRHEIIRTLTRAIDETDFLISSNQLIDIALELTDECNEKNHNRLLLLIDIYKSRSDCALENIKYILNDALENIGNIEDISA